MGDGKFELALSLLKRAKSHLDSINYPPARKKVEAKIQDCQESISTAALHSSHSALLAHSQQSATSSPPRSGSKPPSSATKLDWSVSGTAYAKQLTLKHIGYTLTSYI